MSITRSSRRLAAVLALVLVPGLTAGVATAAPSPAPGSSGVGDPYYPADGNGGIDVQKYRIKQRLDFERKRLSGTTVVTLRATQRLSSFNLDFLLPVRRVTVDGAAARVSQGRHELTITPRRPLEVGATARVRVTYAGKPGAARYRASAGSEKNFIATRHDMIAVNEPHIAPWWHPANDHPSDRAAYDVTTSVPRGMQVIGNGRLVSKKVKGSRMRWRWRADEPMASYLAFFVAGRYRIKRSPDASGRPSWYAVSRSLPKRDQKAAMRSLLRTPRHTRWLEKRLGRDYPFSTNGGVVVASELGFALENQTRPVYSWWGSLDEVVVHELAHQWFGDLVTVRQWRDIWLNEGFATYFEIEYSAEQAGLSSDDVLYLMRGAYRASDDFWRVRIGDPGKADLFSEAVYNRGAMTLFALRNRVGKATFTTILQTWIDEQAGRSASVADFEALAARVSGQDLSGFFTTWLRTPRRPAKTAANGLGDAPAGLRSSRLPVDGSVLSRRP